MLMDPQLLQRIKSNDKTLIQLDLSLKNARKINRIGAEGAKTLAAALEKNHTLTQLNLGCSDIGDEGGKALAEALAKNQTLTSLSVSSNKICDAGAKALALALEKNQTLISVDLSFNRIGDAGAKALALALEKNQTLTSVDLRGNRIGDEDAKALALALEKNQTLTSVRLSHNLIGAEGAKALALALEKNQTLTSVRLSHNLIGAEGAKALALALEKNQTLTSVRLSHSKIGDAGAKALALALEKNKTLTSVGLLDNNIGAEGAKALALALEKNQTLTSVDLRNSIGDEGAKALALALEKNQTLTSVNLGNNLIHAEGAKALALALEKNQTLTSVRLSHNLIDAEGAKALALALEKNQTLTSVDLRGNRIGDEGAKTLALALEKNQTLTSVDLNGNRINAELEKRIKQKIEANRQRAKQFLQAAKNNQIKLVKQYIEQGVNINYQDEEGNTALHIAAREGYQKITEHLLSQPCILQLQNAKGEYPTQTQNNAIVKADEDDSIILPPPSKKAKIVHEEVPNSSLISSALESHISQALMTKLQLAGLKYEAIPGDGHCLYRAVCLYLEQDVRLLRHIVAAHLEFNCAEFEGFIPLEPGQTLANYLDAVRQGNEWASHVEIEVLMRVLNRPILVVGPDANITNLSDRDRFKGEPIFVYYNGHNHYDALIQAPGTTSQAIITHLQTLSPNAQDQMEDEPMTKSWHFADDIKAGESSSVIESYKLIPAKEHDTQKVLSFYSHHPMPGMDIQRIEIIYNPELQRGFFGELRFLQRRHGKAEFVPQWKQDGKANIVAWRAQIHDKYEDMARSYTDEDFPHVKLLPMWHGTSEAAAHSICEMGYVNLATTDGGFFGGGIYSAHEAEYAYRVYSNNSGVVLLNWVASYSAYPTIRDDEAQDERKYRRYDARFVPVVPASKKSDEVNYLATKPGEKHTYTEMVVFQRNQCLPRYLVRLVKNAPHKGIATNQHGLFALKPAAIDIRTVADDVYRQYLAKPFTQPKSAKINWTEKDWEYKYKKVIIPRPNHGLAHTLRTVYYVGPVLKCYLAHYSNLPVEMKKALLDSRTKMQLALLFFVVGRDNEANSLDDKASYQRFREASAQAFRHYVTQKGLLSPAEGEQYALAIQHLNGDEKGQFASSPNLVKHINHIIRLCHNIDLMRCLTETESLGVWQQVNYLLDEANSQSLQSLVYHCLVSTGDRILGHSEPQTYQGERFVKASQDIDYCINAIKQGIETWEEIQLLQNAGPTL